jgi:hypothetical protein
VCCFVLFCVWLVSAHRSQDKTFGLKNKKGKKQQQFVQQVQSQVRGNDSEAKVRQLICCSL